MKDYSTTTTTMIIRAAEPTMNATYHNLQYHNTKKATLLIPVVVVCALCMIVGIIGSSLVCFVCGLRLRKNVTNTFVLALAFVDLISCVLCIPLEIMELRLPYLYDYPVLCKVLRTLRSVTTITSGLILVAIAIERYNRICKPLNKHINISQANRACVAVLMCGVVCSWPAALLFGNKVTDIPGVDEDAIECSIDEYLAATFYPFAFYTFLFLLYFGTSLTLGVLYSLIALTIWKRRKLLTNIRNRSPPALESVAADQKSYSSGDTCMSHSKFVEQLANHMQKGRKPTLTRTSSVVQQRRVYSRRRTTCIMFFMTTTFIVSCLPYVVISIIRSVVRDFESNLSDSQEVFYQLGLKSFIISSAVNPYIYGFSNGEFKQECYKLLKTIFCESEKAAVTRRNTSRNSNSARMVVKAYTGESEA